MIRRSPISTPRGAGTDPSRRVRPSPPLTFTILGARLESPLNGSMGTTRGAMFARNARRRAHRTAARWHMVSQLRGRNAHSYGCSLEDPIVVTITRVAPRALDDDNLAASAKSVRDGIADAMGIDDRSPLIAWRYAQARGAVGEYSVRVTVQAGKPTDVGVASNTRRAKR